MYGKTTINFDEIFQNLGQFGPFQVFIYILACLCYFFAGYFIVTPIFGTKILPYRCKIPACDGSQSAYDEAFLNFTTPWTEDLKLWEGCKKFSFQESAEIAPSTISASIIPSSSCIPKNFDLSELVSCDEWVYDTSEFRSTTIMDFKLTCDREWMVPLESSFIMIGYLIGSILMGILSDKFGRKCGILISASILCFAGLISSFAPNMYVFLPLRLLAAIGSLGCFQTAFVTAIEFISPKWRTVCGIMINACFTIGEATVGLVAYSIRDWRQLYIACSVPSLVLLSYYWILPESIRWLMTQNRKEEALQIIRKIAKINRTHLPVGLEEDILNADINTEKNSDVSLLKLMKSSTIRRRSLVLFYCWIVCSLLYYGLSNYVGQLMGSVFVNFAVVILIEIPGFIAAAVGSNILGRKLVMIVSFMIGGLACITAGFSSPGLSSMMVPLSVIGKLGITSAFGGIYSYTAELYPTEYRSIGLGICSMHSRIGGIMAPFIANLANTYKPLPSLIFGVMSLLAGVLILALPETKGYKLPETLEESEELGRNQSWYRFRITGKDVEETVED